MFSRLIELTRTQAKKKKKKPAESDASEQAKPAETPKPYSPTQPKSAKKGKGKDKKKDDRDDLDMALAELSQKCAILKHTGYCAHRLKGTQNSKVWQLLRRRLLGTHPLRPSYLSQYPTSMQKQRCASFSEQKPS